MDDTPPNSPGGFHDTHQRTQVAVLDRIRHTLQPPPISFTEDLDLAFTPVNDLPQRLHPALRSLDLTGNKLHECPDLNSLGQLEFLCLRQNYIKTLVGVLPGGYSEAERSNLDHLDVYDNQLESTEGIEHLRKLTYLDFSFNRLREISGLDHLSQLNELYLIQNKITEISNISHLTQLKMLELGSNRLRKIDGISELVNLEKLYLGRNKITKIEGLSTLRRLRCLSLQYNRITVLEGLEGLEALEELYVSNNGIKEITGLSSLKHLVILDVGNNFIESVSGLDGLDELQDFWCNGNPINSLSTVHHLACLPSLETVYFENTPLQRSQPDYRVSVLSVLQTLKQIDADEVTAAERNIVKKAAK